MRYGGSKPSSLAQEAKNEFKVAMPTCLRCGGKDAVFCRLFTDTSILRVKLSHAGRARDRLLGKRLLTTSLTALSSLLLLRRRRRPCQFALHGHAENPHLNLHLHNYRRLQRRQRLAEAREGDNVLQNLKRHVNRAICQSRRGDSEVRRRRGQEVANHQHQGFGRRGFTNSALPAATMADTTGGIPVECM
jgi:hypothetical protein